MALLEIIVEVDQVAALVDPEFFADYLLTVALDDRGAMGADATLVAAQWMKP